MIVAILGSYSEGNFGDDLMAVMLAIHCQRRALTPIICGGSPALNRAAPCDVIPDVPIALSRAGYCLFGGGSLLASKNHMPASYHARKREQYWTVIKALQITQCPISYVSIGGDGSTVSRESIGDYRDDLLRLPNGRGATVRLPHDVEGLRHYGLAANYYPDIVLSVRSFFGSTRVGRTRDGHICLNLPSQYKSIKTFIRIAQAINRGLVVTFVGSTYDAFVGPRPKELFWRRESSTRRNVAYTSPADTIAAIEGAFAMFTYKLHLGVAALAYHVPYILVGDSAKSMAFLRTLNVGPARLPGRALQIAMALLRLLSTRRGIRSLKTMYDWAEIDQLVAESQSHFGFVDGALGEGQR